MGGKLSVIVRGRLMKKIDDNLTQPDKASLDELTAGTSMVDLGLAKGILTTQGDVDHVNDEVFGDNQDPDAWWPDEPEKQEVVRGGFIQAITGSRGHQPPVPIHSYWISGVNTFEVIVADRITHVDLFLLTPNPRVVPQPANVGLKEDLWMVATKDRCDEIYNGIPNNYPKEKPEDVPGVTAQRLRLCGY
jgi:hypothetical protein